MRNSWLGIEAGTNPVDRDRELRRDWETFVSGGERSSAIRDVVVESWGRCVAAGLPLADRHQPPLCQDDARARWAEHPLRGLMPVVHETLASIALDSEHLVAITDDRGLLLWIEGDRRVMRAAEEETMFVEGALCSEQGTGTNAIGVALVHDHPVQIFASEHFSEWAHGWSCSAAPIHDPSGRVLGVIDLTSRMTGAHPHTLALAAAIASQIEAELRSVDREIQARHRERHMHYMLTSRETRRALLGPDGRLLISDPPGWTPQALAVPPGGGEITLPDGREVVVEVLGPDGCFLVREPQTGASSTKQLRLSALGIDRGVLALGNTEQRLTRRHSEILAMLMLRPAGTTSEELCLELYGEEGKPVTLRVELHRLRKVLGSYIDPQQLRLAIDFDSDFLLVRKLLEAGRIREAVKAYHGTLLPRSIAPGIERERSELDGALRRAVIGSDDVDTLWGWLESPSGQDDMFAWKRFLSTVDFSDGRRALAASRIDNLRALLELG